MPPTDATIINTTALDNLRTLLGPQADMMLPILAGKFYDEAPRLLAQIRETYAAGKPEEVRRAAHTLKSNSANFGAIRVAHLAEQMEAEARNQDLSNTLTLVAQAETEFAAAQTILQEII